MTDLWSEASYDYDAERRTRNLEMAKAASQGTWAFLARAQSFDEYKDRVALASDQIMATAANTGVDMTELINLFDQRFALLMEAKGNPFADDSDDSDSDSDPDSSDDSGSDDQDDDSDDSDSDSDSDDDSDSDSSDDDDDDSDDSSDDSDDGDDSDSGDQDDTSNQPPQQQGFQPYASLAARIQAGEDPLVWGGAPFAHSSARKEAADGATELGPVSDVNSPQPEPMDAPGAAAAPGMAGGVAESTKPRQLPSGESAPGMGMDAIADPMMDQPFDPAMNGGDIQQGANDLPPAQSSRGNKLSAIMREVKRYNPTLSNDRCWKVASQVYDQYLSKHAEDMSPLLFGDRGNVSDGPATHKVKTWSPPDLKPPSGGGTEQGPGEGGPKKPPGLPGAGVGAAEEAGAGAAAAGAAGAEGAGMAAGVAEAAELLPLLAL